MSAIRRRAGELVWRGACRAADGVGRALRSGRDDGGAPFVAVRDAGRVTALDTGRAVVVRINDRGPFKKGRIIDLSHGAARLLGADRGLIPRVRLRALPPATRLGLVGAGRESR